MYLAKAQLDDYQDFAREQLGFEFKDPYLIVRAMTHRSYVNEHRKSSDEHNERLEFLGDAILEFIVSDYLYRNYNKPEGTMTAWRSALVRTEALTEAGTELGYFPLIRMSHGERYNCERNHGKAVADCFEALTAAIYLDQGYQPVKDFIYKHVLSRIEKIIGNDDWRDPKTYLQEFTQKLDGTTPQYHTIKQEGPDHDRTFTVALYVGKKIRGTGIGHSKQDAQVAAAKEAIEYYKSTLTKEELAEFQEALQ